MANGMLQKIGGWVAALMKSEKLDDLPETRTDSARTSFLGWLLKPEDLPLEEPLNLSTKAPFLATLFSRERLSVDPMPERSPRVRGRRIRGG